MLSLRAAGIVSTVLEAILYGLSVFMAALSGFIMFRYRRRERINYGLVVAGCALLILATAEMGVNTTRLYQGFLTIGPSLPNGPEEYFGDVSQTTFVVKSCLYNTQTLILDGIVIYRAYIVWQNIWIVAVPILVWFSLFAVSIGLNISLVTAGSHKGNVFATATGSWITANYSMTLGTNLTSTMLLAYKIWTISRRSAQYRANDAFSPALRVIIESGAIYSITITVALILFVVQSPAVYIMLDLISPIISIVFHMLIIHIGITNRRAFAPSQTAVSTGQSSGTWRHGSRGSGKRRRGADESYAMQSLKVEISQIVEEDVQQTPRLYTDTNDTVLELKRGSLGVNDSEEHQDAASEERCSYEVPV